MFSKLFSLFSGKRKFLSAEETNPSVDEGSNRPTKRVRIEEPSSTNEDQTEHNSPVQAACTINEQETEENEVMDDLLPRGTEEQAVERGEETRAVDARLREEIRNRVEPDGQVGRLLWQAAMDEAREQGRQQRMEEFWREQERVHEERRRDLFTQPHDEPMGDVERRLTAPLPLRRASPPFSFSSSLATDASLPSFGIPLVSASSQPSPRILNAWDFGSQVSPIRDTPIFICPPSPQPAPRRRPTTSLSTSPTVVDQSSSATILASIRQLRGQFPPAVSPHPSEDDEQLEDDDESGDEDLPLFTAMFQAGNPPPNSEHRREYPVYEEDLDLPEDQPQAGEDLHEEIARRWALAQRRRARVDEDEEDGETAEERLERLVREGEAEDGVDLE